MKRIFLKVTKTILMVTGTITILGVVGFFAYKALTHKRPEVVAAEVDYTVYLAKERYRFADSIIKYAPMTDYYRSEAKTAVSLSFSLMDNAYVKLMDMPRCQPRLVSYLFFEMAAHHIGWGPGKTPYDRYRELVDERHSPAHY